MSTKKKRGPGRPSRYAPEFQRDAVTMVLDEKGPTLMLLERWGERRDAGELGQ